METLKGAIAKYFLSSFLCKRLFSCSFYFHSVMMKLLVNEKNSSFARVSIKLQLVCRNVFPCFHHKYMLLLNMTAGNIPSGHTIIIISLRVNSWRWKHNLLLFLSTSFPSFLSSNQSHYYVTVQIYLECHKESTSSVFNSLPLKRTVSYVHFAPVMNKTSYWYDITGKEKQCSSETASLLRLLFCYIALRHPKCLFPYFRSFSNYLPPLKSTTSPHALPTFQH